MSKRNNTLRVSVDFPTRQWVVTRYVGIWLFELGRVIAHGKRTKYEVNPND